MQKPVHIFLFLVALGLVITGLSFLSPKDKVKLSEFELGFYQPQDLLGPFWSPGEGVLEDTLAWAVDSLDLDTLPAEVVEVVKQMPAPTIVQQAPIIQAAPVTTAMAAPITTAVAPTYAAPTTFAAPTTTFAAPTSFASPIVAETFAAPTTY